MNSSKLILFIAANPAGSSDTQWKKEFRTIRNIIQNSTLDNYCSLNMEADATPEDFLASLKNKPWLIHFCGHGLKNGQIALIKDDKKAFFVGTKELLETIKNVKGLSCILFSSCFSSHLIEETQKIVSYSIGFEGTTINLDAIDFAKKFYKNLDFEDIETIPNAYQRTLEALNFEQRNGLKPILKRRSDYIMNEIIEKGNYSLVDQLTAEGQEELRFLEIQKRETERRIERLGLTISGKHSAIQTVNTHFNDHQKMVLEGHDFQADIMWFKNQKKELVEQIGRKLLPNEPENRRKYYCNQLKVMLNYVELAFMVSNYAALNEAKNDLKDMKRTFEMDMYKRGFDEMISSIKMSPVSQQFRPFFADHVKYIKDFLMGSG